VVRIRELPSPAVVAGAYLVGSIPFSGILARRLRGVDLRETGTGTVSGTGLYRVAGVGPLIVGGVLDLAKGCVGPLLAGPRRPALRALAGAAAVVGHDWSIFLGGAGGRGVSTAMGAMLLDAPEGSALLLAGVAAGRAARATSVGTFAAMVTLLPVLSRTRGRRGALIAGALVTPMLLKRVLGNRPPRPPDRLRTSLIRLVFDQDAPPWSSSAAPAAGASPRA